jgi:glutaredoxin
MITSTFEIYGKASCIYCERAKALCEDQNVPYKYYQLDEDFTRNEMLERFPDAKSYPQILHNEIQVGGYTQMVELLNKR